MEQDRQLAPPDALDQPVQPGHVVEVPMAEHNRLERVRRDAQPVEALDQTERADTGVIQDTMHPPTPRGRTGSGPLGPESPQRRTGPTSGSSMSAVLSSRVVTTTRSTGASSS